MVLAEYTDNILQYIKVSHALIVMYSVTNRKTFNDVVDIIGDITRVKSQEAKPIPILIVG